MAADNYQQDRALYHFTDLVGVKHILAEQRLRLTGLSKLHEEDRQEIAFGINAVRESIDDYSKRPKLTKRQRDVLKSLLWGNMVTMEAFGELFDCFIACFSRDHEDADLWRDYGDDGKGVAIAVRSSYFRSPDPMAPLERGVTHPFVIGEVTYGIVSPKVKAAKALDEMLRVISEIEAVGVRDEEFRKVVAELHTQLMVGTVVPVALVAKEETFAHEVETRGVKFGRHKVGSTRPIYEYEPLKHHEIEGIYFSPRTDLGALEKIIASAGLSVSGILKPSYPIFSGG